ncbi:response regulator [Aliiroseovarius lamellibrachiae]|uniref:response regulator n=1 Tax=Aliiroseovarius lamellibrachiae TaxID=1924933 RepID=UPI001BDF9F68|nr:response regulator [Aliiroseovarius lamellibrachiae]MBT2131473.1 response regulator [Aliiroseovarius lamellibrachiae]
MRVLIVETNADLAEVWARSLERQGAVVTRADGEDRAISAINQDPFDVIVMNIKLGTGNALTVSDYAGFRLPNARVIFVTNSSFFSDGSIFQHASNAHACIPDQTPAEDLAALVEYHGKHAAELSG